MEADTKSSPHRLFLRPPSPARDSSSPIPEQAEETNGREKRVRKSINYAEPKLNTYVPFSLLLDSDPMILCRKMRKPDPGPGSEPPRRKRSSAARNSTHKPSSSSSTASDAPQGAIVDADTGAVHPSQTPQTTLPLRSSDGNQIDPENFPIPPSRPGSAAAMYSPGPPSRTTGSTTSSQSSTTASSTSTSGTGTAEPSQYRSRPQLVASGDDSDGAYADSEYGNGGHTSSSGSIAWSNVNVDSGRRRGLPKRTAATAAVAAMEDIRRHSMVI
jgi:hypothetical protein